MRITTYEQTVLFLESFVARVQMRYDQKYLKEHDPLDRMRILLSLLGNPQEKFKSVLVGGTSGKGSTSYLIAHILKTAGYKTGLMVKPHLQKVNERIQINEFPISDVEFVGYINRLIPVINHMKTLPVGEPSYFEILTAMGFLYFVDKKVDIAIVEVGMGGEFDATNTLYPLITVITNVSLDHTEYLGKTVQKIAKTKAGIIKKIVCKRAEVANENFLVRSAKKDVQSDVSFDSANVHSKNFVGSSRVNSIASGPIVITGAKQLSVVKIIEKRCREIGAKLYKLNRDFRYKIKKEDTFGSTFLFREKGYKSPLLHIKLIGAYQVENAALALETIFQLVQFGFPLSDHDIICAFENASFPGRFEILFVRGPVVSFLSASARSNLSASGGSNELRAVGSPSVSATPRFPSVAQDKISRTLILDGAHNAEKMRAFLAALKKLYKYQKKIFIIAFKNDKNITPMLPQILRVAHSVIVTEFHATTDFAKSNYSATPIGEIKNIIEQIGDRGELVVKNRHKTPIYYQKDSKRALEKAEQTVGKEKDFVIVVTGSLYLVGEVKRFFESAKNT